MHETLRDDHDVTSREQRRRSAAWRSRSISWLIAESFSMYRSFDGT